MGIGVGPGTASRPRGGDAGSDGGELSGYAAIAQYGHGRQDPVTGAFEWYEYPEGYGAQSSATQTIEIGDLLRHGDPIVADFASEYGIRLYESPRLSWRVFCIYLAGLVRPGTRLAAAVTAATTDNDDEVG